MFNQNEGKELKSTKMAPSGANNSSFKSQPNDMIDNTNSLKFLFIYLCLCYQYKCIYQSILR